MKKMVISFDEAVETLKEHYGVSDVEIVDLPAKRNETPAEMQVGVKDSNEYWQFGMLFDSKGNLKLGAVLDAVILMRRLYKSYGLSEPTRFSWIDEPDKVTQFFDYVETYNELPPEF